MEMIKPTHDSIPANWEEQLNADFLLPWVEDDGDNRTKLTLTGAKLVYDLARLVGINTTDRYTMISTWDDFFKRFREESKNIGQCKGDYCPRCEAAILMALGYGSLLNALGAAGKN